MTKKEIVTEFQTQVGLSSYSEAERMFDGFTSLYSNLFETAAPKEAIPFGSAGIFHPVIRAERGGINPQTKEKIVIPSKKDIKFTCSRDTKARMKANLANKE